MIYCYRLEQATSIIISDDSPNNTLSENLVEFITEHNHQPVLGGIVMIAEQTDKKVDWAKILNPFYKKHRKYGAILTISAPENYVFDCCRSALRAADLRYESHQALGKIIALQPAKEGWLKNSFFSLGVDIYVEIEPQESGETVVGIVGESRRTWLMLNQPSRHERYKYEAKIVTEQIFSLLGAILERKGIVFSEYTVISPDELG